MSSSQNNKSKTQIKTEKEIKKEPVELKSLDKYIDDRVELIKQTFNCLKPKTIKSFAPDFLQEKPLEAIKAYCLDEILGISKKRLISIIRATKCPSDTETSNSENDDDNNDDLHQTNNIIEHISLDEISSDSDDNLTNKNKSKNEKQNGKPEEIIEVKKEFSVLELLELQARARAIRSQLALEPVTKIELDSDKEGEDTDSNASVTRKRKLNEGLPISINTANLNEEENNEKSIKVEEQPKRVRLKRNFRKRQLSNKDDDDDDDNMNNENVENLITESKEIEEKVKENIEVKAKSPVPSVASDNEENDNKKERDVCSSPEVITLQQSPETLCISSDDDAVNMNNVKNKLNKVETKFIVLFDKKNAELEKQMKEQEAKAIEAARLAALVVKTPEPPEEGEIVDDDEEEEEPGVEEIVESSIPNDDKNENDNKDENKIDEIVDEVMVDDTKEKEKEKEKLSKEINEEQNYEEKLDDVIDINEEELDFDMKESSDVQKVVENVNESKSIDDNSDVVTIDLEESEPEGDAVDEEMNEAPNNESLDKSKMDWSSRWLGSKKVTKILATSRLGNRLRDKIKLKKLANSSINNSTNINKEIKPQPNVIIDQNYEEGSIQHYEELNKNKELNNRDATKSSIIDKNEDKDDVINNKKIK